MTHARWSIPAALIAFTLLTGINGATAQGTLKVEDLVGMWELVSTKDLKTGAAVLGLTDARTGIHWMQFTRSHYMAIAMERGRKVTPPDAFAKLSPEEKVTINYARIWNEKNELIFAARGGTYSLEGDTIRQKPTIALDTAIIGVDLVLKVTRLDKSTMVAQYEYPTLNPTTTRELTSRRVE